MTLAFSCNVVHEKLWKSVNNCKSYSKKIIGTFFSGHGVYTVVWLRNVHNAQEGQDSVFSHAGMSRILGIKWYDKDSNAAVRGITKLPDLLSLIADRRQSFVVWSRMSTT